MRVVRRFVSLTILGLLRWKPTLAHDYNKDKMLLPQLRFAQNNRQNYQQEYTYPQKTAYFTQQQLKSRGGGGNVSLDPNPATTLTTSHHRTFQRIGKVLLFERHTASAILALGLFCFGVYAMWIIVEEAWHIAAVAFGFKEHLVLIQFITSTLAARTNGWVWWNFLKDKQYQQLEDELAQREATRSWDYVMLERVYGTMWGSLLSLFSYFSCFQAVASMFYIFAEWGIRSILGHGSFGSNASVQYIAMSLMILAVSGVALYRLLGYDLLIRMWDSEDV